MMFMKLKGVASAAECSSGACADGFGRGNLERAESAEAESPPNTQLYALRSRGAATNATLAAAAGQHLGAAGLARSPHHAANESGGVMADAAAAASDAMDMSVSQGPIKTRLKVCFPSQLVLQGDVGVLLCQNILQAVQLSHPLALLTYGTPLPCMWVCMEGVLT